MAKPTRPTVPHLLVAALALALGLAAGLLLPFASRVAPVAPAETATNGAQIARQVCATCHVFPDPSAADRFTWANTILPRMNTWLGYPSVDWAAEPGGDQVLASGKIARRPLVDSSSLKQIHDYYLSAAPLEMPARGHQPVGSLKNFKARLGARAEGPPATTLVRIDPANNQLLVGQPGRVVLLGAEGKLASVLPITNSVVHLLERSDGFYATLIGSLVPSDLAQGQVVHWRRAAAGSTEPFEVREILNDLRRPVASAVADLNEDGLEDLVVASFGNVLGRFSWYEQRPDGSYQEHVLLDRAGAVGVMAADLDDDARADIVVTMAQAQEGIFAFLNRGEGRFEQVTIVEKHPAWGFTHMEPVDFNQDGRIDLLVTNGDNGDNITLPNGPRPYHGLRLYLNEGQGTFGEAWFHPFDGAYRAVARDFDMDGDLDIAAVSFFPDYRNGKQHGFVYLENLGDLQFAASTFAQAIAGRWITLDAGDLDGDGDADLVLGANNRSFGDVPLTLAELWQEHSPWIVFLENTIR